MPTKQELYTNLVKARRQCRRPECQPLCNQADVDVGRYDYDQIGSLSCWQGDLDAKIMVILRDWGSIEDFREWRGYPTHGSGISKTNQRLIKLLNTIGIRITECASCGVRGPLFFTNAILCLQPERRSAPVKQMWANVCCRAFLRPLIDLIKPAIVITMSPEAYTGTMLAYHLRPLRVFRQAVADPLPVQLNSTCVLFPLYHPAVRDVNRTWAEQLADWGKIKTYMDKIELKV